jgi:hypothetical protein
MTIAIPVRRFLIIQVKILYYNFFLFTFLKLAYPFAFLPPHYLARLDTVTPLCRLVLAADAQDLDRKVLSNNINIIDSLYNIVSVCSEM